MEGWFLTNEMLSIINKHYQVYFVLVYPKHISPEIFWIFFIFVQMQFSS